MRIDFVNFEWSEDHSIFASPAYLEAIGKASSGIDSFGWIGGWVANSVRFVLPYVLQRKLIFCTAQFQSATITLGPPSSPSEEKVFLDGVAHFLRARGVDAIVQPTVNALFRTYPDRAIHAPYGSYVLDLTVPEQALWNAMDQHHRRSVKSATKSGVTISRETRHLDRAHRLLMETMGRSGMEAGERDSLKALIAGLGDNVRLFTAWKDDACQSCAVMPFSRNSASYLYGGRSEASARGAHNLLHWEAIRHFRELGVSRYDFHGARIAPRPGSKQDGIQRFKVRFGGRLETGLLWKLPLRPMKYLAYQQALVLRGRMRGRAVGADIIDQELASVASQPAPHTDE